MTQCTCPAASEDDQNRIAVLKKADPWNVDASDVRWLLSLVGRLAAECSCGADEGRVKIIEAVLKATLKPGSGFSVPTRKQFHELAEKAVASLEVKP